MHARGMDSRGRIAGPVGTATAQIHLASCYTRSLNARSLAMADGRKAVVLLSGGMDSCVCAATACKQHGAHNVALLHASYGQRTESREARAFCELGDVYGVEPRLMVQLARFRGLGGSE